jgi:KUP system potassium uptake protein
MGANGVSQFVEAEATSLRRRPGEFMATASIPDTTQPALKHIALVGALGVVFGDIGTSPLYAFKEALHSAGNVEALRPIVLGCVSLVFWALIIVVSVKYVLVVMRATNDGEGGIMALTALAATALKNDRWREAAILCGMLGAALFYGDCIITPAISVLSAVEGLQIATPVLKPYIVPISAGILAALFILQSRGTARIGGLFGPIMLVWFAVIGVAGLAHILKSPEVLEAVNPIYGLDLIAKHGWTGFHVLGSVFLVVTGAEALYADEGHFKGDVIRLDWFSVVLPALLLNYFGQGSLVLSNAAAAENPFYFMFPSWALYPAVGMAAAATVIASQAVISGAFTMTQQAMLLGFLPRMEVRFTSKTEASQIYVPQINWLLAAAVLGLVFGFKSSGSLAGAYGVAVSTTMLATTVLVAVVARYIWHWSLALIGTVISFLFAVDAAFFGANLIKIFEGGYVPLLAGAAIFIAMSTWHRGRTALLRLSEQNPPLEQFWTRMHCENLPRVPGVAVYLTSRGDRVPASLKLNVKHNKCLHETVVLLKVITERIPRVLASERVTAEPLDHGFVRVILRFGFAESPDVPRVLKYALAQEVELGFKMDQSGVSYFVGRAIPVPSDKPELPAWREPIFIFLTKNSATASNFFCIPPEQVVELGTFVEI